MPGVTLIASDVRTDREAIERSFAEVRDQHCPLHILGVLDMARAARVASRFSDCGQIGSRPSEGFLKTLGTRLEQLIAVQVEEISAEAERIGLNASGQVRRGDYTTETTTALREIQPDVVVLERRRRALLRSATSDSFLDALQQELRFRLIEV
ncbi:MAG: hypothetical protein ACI8TX_000242 [Hyphomicrobiaceae bacterium]|jgi:hypothetical protein